MANEMTIDERLDTFGKSQLELATIVRDMAAHVYKEDGMYEEEEYEEKIDLPPMDDEMLPSDDDDLQLSKGDDEDDDEDKDEDTYMDKSKVAKQKARIAQHQRVIKRHQVALAKLRKGYDDSAMDTVDEEDAPFDEQQSSVDGNEPSPAGEMDGDREDETFNAKFSQIESMVGNLHKELISQGVLKSNAVVPPVGTVNKGRETADKNVVTRDMEKELKGRSYKEINAAREYFEGMATQR